PSGDTRVVITYRVDSGSPLTTPVQLALYASATPSITPCSRLLGTTTISLTERDADGNLALAPGTHTLRRTTSDLACPTNHSVIRDLPSSDYCLVARIDSGNAVAESNERNNDVVYTGVYRVAGSNRVFVQGSDGPDVLAVRQCNGTLMVSFDN